MRGKELTQAPAILLQPCYFATAILLQPCHFIIMYSTFSELTQIALQDVVTIRGLPHSHVPVMSNAG